MSINDVVAAPAGALAIGEAFTRLSGWFDRSGAAGYQTVSQQDRWLLASFAVVF